MYATLDIRYKALRIRAENRQLIGALLAMRLGYGPFYKYIGRIKLKTRVYYTYRDELS